MRLGRFLIACILILGASTRGPSAAQAQPAWNGERAMADIAHLLEFTPRSPGKPGHDATIRYIEAALGELPGIELRKQHWTFVNGKGNRLALTNIVARLNPSAIDRMIVGTHFDGIVRAYRDSRRPFAKMPGANNSASGVALLLETLRSAKGHLAASVGVDFVFFDGEEGQYALGAGDDDWFALGSPYFAKHLKDFYPANLPRHAAIFDMVCYKKLRLKQETNSIAFAPQEVAKFWRIGARQAPSIFSPAKTRVAIGDDQSALNEAGIPSILVIGFDYEPWFNTTGDTLDKCSAESLSAVGRTLLEYLGTP